MGLCACTHHVADQSEDKIGKNNSGDRIKKGMLFNKEGRYDDKRRHAVNKRLVNPIAELARIQGFHDQIAGETVYTRKAVIRLIAIIDESKESGHRV